MNRDKACVHMQTWMTRTGVVVGTGPIWFRARVRSPRASELSHQLLARSEGTANNHSDGCGGPSLQQTALEFYVCPVATTNLHLISSILARVIIRGVCRPHDHFLFYFILNIRQVCWNNNVLPLIRWTGRYKFQHLQVSWLSAFTLNTRGLFSLAS
jgi:hypothetical protein